MGVWVVDPDWYFTTAEVLGRAASELAGAAGTVSAVADFAGLHMAGNDPIGTGWGSTYDAGASATVQGVVALTKAWSALAGRIYQAGVNHAWVEFRNGRGRLPVPANLPPEPAITQLSLTMQTSVGGNGIGLDELLPGLLEMLGRETPNANTDKLHTAADAWSRFAAGITDAVDGVIRQTKRPDPSMPDAIAFYDSIIKVSAPGDALATDARALGSQTGGFSAGVSTMRQSIDRQVKFTALMLGGSGSVSIVASGVTGGLSIRAEAALARRLIQRASDNIRGYINTLQTTASLINTFSPVFDPAMKSLLDKEALIPAVGYEPRPDGTLKPTVRYFDRAKWAAWQRYLERGGDWDIDRWSKAYDQLLENSANGWWYDQLVADIMGYDSEEGWRHQYSNGQIVPGRRWDWAHLVDGIPDEVVENKSGRLDFDQLRADEEALQAGLNLTYNINSKYPYSEAELAELQRLQDEYPDQFRVNRLP